MYVFSSAIFFLLFFSLFKPEDGIKLNVNIPLEKNDRIEYIHSLEKKLQKDTGNIKIKEALAVAKDTTKEIMISEMLKGETKEAGLSFTGSKYKSFSKYDSVEKTLPPDKRDGWIMRRLQKKQIEIDQKYRENPDEGVKKLAESVLHRLPYMLFVSLPLFAWILKMVYFRRKQFYYADHGVFTIHLYVFTFLLLMVIFGLNKLENLTGWGFLSIVSVILFLGLFFYLYKAMRKFYGQRRGKTILKFILVSSLSLLMMIILFTLFMFFSAVTL
jgi:hypothetical protein